MKILIAYYSRTGNTEKLAQVIKKELENRGHLVDVEKILPKKEHSFWGWQFIRIFKGECQIQPPKIKNVSKYDAICIGSPNWTRLSLPVAKYLREIKGLEYKRVGFFATSAGPPIFEWYFISAYLLDLTFSQIIEKRKGRIIESILLSSVFKNWSLESDYGKRLIKNFCDKLTTPTFSFKDYLLKQEETKNLRFFAVFLSAFFIISLILQIFKKEFFGWEKFSYLAIVSLSFFILLSTMKEKKFYPFLGSYLGSFSLILLWTFIILFGNFPLTVGKIIHWGYVLIFIIISFLRDPKFVAFSGIISFLGYGILFHFSSAREFLKPPLDLFLIGTTCGIIALFTNSFRKYYSNLLDAYDEIEAEKSVLEVRVRARTKELEQLAANLDQQVKERTKELQERVKELERFQKLALGRELKMIELKKEIEKLKKELEKTR